MITQVAIADDQEGAIWSQGGATLLEQAQGDLVTDYLLLVERRVAQHQISAGGVGIDQPITDEESRITAGTGAAEVLPGRGDRSVGLVDEAQLRVGVAQCRLDAQGPIAAAQINDARRPLSPRNAGQHDTGTDIQAIPGEYAGQVGQLHIVIGQGIVGIELRQGRGKAGIEARGQQTGLLPGEGRLVRTDIPGQQISGAGRQVFEHGAGNHHCIGGQQRPQAAELIFEQGQAFRNAQQHTTDRTAGQLLAVDEGDRRRGQLVVLEVVVQRAFGQMGITPAHHRRTRQGQGAGQGAELVIDHQYPVGIGRQRRQLLQQIQIRGIERLQGGVTGRGIAVEPEAAERGIARMHGRAGKTNQGSQYSAADPAVQASLQRQGSAV